MNTGNENLKILERLEKEFIKDGFETLTIKTIEDHELLACKNNRIYCFFVWHDFGFGANKLYKPIMCGYLSWQYTEDEQNGNKRECHGGYTELSKNTYDDIVPTIRELEAYLTEESKIYGDMDKEDFEELKGMFAFYDFEDGLNDEIVKRWIDKRTGRK